MGGIGSGNYGGRPTVEASLSLDLYDLMRKNLLGAGCSRAGSFSWSRSGGPSIASVRYAARLGDEAGLLNLIYVSTDNATGERREHDYLISLETSEQPFGGRRWWFVCPVTGKRVNKLHMPGGNARFASQAAHRLAYATQRQSPRDRATTRSFRLRKRLGDRSGGVGDYVAKPKWMRHSTFERERERLWSADEVCDGYLVGFVEKLLKRR